MSYQIGNIIDGEIEAVVVHDKVDMSNWIDVNIPGSSVQTVCVAQVVVDYSTRSGMKWIDSTKNCPLSEPELKFSGSEIVAKHPVVGLASDAEEYDVATGCLNRAVTIVQGMHSSKGKLSGPRKMLPFLRDSYEAVLEAYNEMCMGRTAEFPDGQKHLRRLLRIPAAYKLGEEFVIDLESQEIIRTIATENEIKMVHQMIGEVIASDLGDFSKRVAVFDLANRFSIPAEDYVKAELIANSDAVVAAANEKLVQNLGKPKTGKEKKTGEEESEDDEFIMTEPSGSGGVRIPAVIPTSKTTPTANKAKKTYKPRR